MKAKELFGRVCLLLLVVAGLTACGNKEEEIMDGLWQPMEWQAELQIDKGHTIEVPQEGGTYQFACTNYRSFWLASSQEDEEHLLPDWDGDRCLVEGTWSRVTVEDNYMTVTVMPNLSGSGRTLLVTPTAGDIFDHFTFVQADSYKFPTLGASQTEGNIFDPIQFSLQTGNSFVTQYELEDLCDSIVWTLKGEPGSFRVFEKEESPGVSGSRLCLSWTHCFTLPGRYEAHLTAWKDNAPLIDSSLEVNITDGKDFLLFNWQDITDNAKGWTGHANVLDEHCRFITNYGQEEGTPFMQLRIFEATPSDSYTLLHDYFCRLYGEPAYGSRTERQQMLDLYTELFSGHKLYPDASPLHIWLTERARVVLLQLEDWAKEADYVVYAEPLR